MDTKDYAKKILGLTMLGVPYLILATGANDKYIGLLIAGYALAAIGLAL